MANPKNISTRLAVRMATHTLWNMIIKKPICIALEVTHNCTANCRHCDKGPEVDDQAVGALEYKKVCDELSASMIQIAGGEPLNRADLADIVRALYRPDKISFLVVVTNASLLTREKYLELRDAGVRQFSISLDFPDSRHDDFRRIPGLYEHLNRLIPELIGMGNGDVTVNTCITRANYPYLTDIIKKVTSWEAKLNFSAYTDLRTHDKQYNLRHPDDTVQFDKIIDQIYSDETAARCVMTSEKVMRRFNRFYKEKCYIPNCQTGYKFLIVNPDATLTPCAMFIKDRYKSQKELIEKFVKKVDCGGCYISIRANTEKSLWELLTDNLRAYKLGMRSAEKYGTR